MSNKKKPAAEAAAVKTERKPNRKERLAAEAAYNEEMAKKRKPFYSGALVIAALAVFISFWSNQYIGQANYTLIQVGCFALMGVSGGCFVLGSRFEVEEKQQKSKRNLGVMFIAIAAVVMVIEVVKMLMM